jgi:hypothetical protein
MRRVRCVHKRERERESRERALALEKERESASARAKERKRNETRICVSVSVSVSVSVTNATWMRSERAYRRSTAHTSHWRMRRGDRTDEGRHVCATGHSSTTYHLSPHARMRRIRCAVCDDV